MAINPGDSRLPRYRENQALPVFRKQSISQAVCLYLTSRDVWSNLTEVYERKKLTGSETSPLPECGAPPLPAAGPHYEPTHHGIIEGVVHINPWLIDLGSYVFVEVTARYRYARSVLDPFDFEINEVVFRKRTQLNPPSDYNKVGADALRRRPTELSSYSRRTRALYEKLGGPVSSQSMVDEQLTASGVLVGMANHSREKHTFVPQTMATQSSGYPDHPYVTYNIPFRFDINGAPDSMYLKSTRKPTNEIGKSPPPNRMRLFYEAVFGFAHHDSDTDPDSPSETEDSDDDEKIRIRHPGEPIRVRKMKPSREHKKRQMEKDLFHPDCYPWRPRPKRAPRDGISWTISAYVVKLPGSSPKTENIASMRIRKLSYVPRNISIDHLAPPRSVTDYCLAVGPRSGFDGGVITLLAKLDKVIYTPGDPIQCDIKFHNSSIRLIHRLNVEVHQCIRIKACASRVWRSFICRRVLDDLSLQTGMPVLPGTEDVLVRVTLNPWPTVSSIQEHFKFPHGPIRPSGIAEMDEAWAIRLPEIPGQEFALETPSRHESVPPQHIQRRALAMSSFSGVLEYLFSIGEPITLLKALGQEPVKDIWQGNPHGACRCVHRERERGEPRRSDHMPPKEPYQVPLNSKDVLPQDEKISESRARQNVLQAFCEKCFGDVRYTNCPLHVSYEVVVHAELLPQHQKNPLSYESAIRQCGLGSGLLIDPNGEIIGPDGPRITLPCLLAHRQPYPEERIPVANYHIDQRQDCKDHVTAVPKIHEPSLGKGFLTSKTYPIAPCNVTQS